MQSVLQKNQGYLYTFSKQSFNQNGERLKKAEEAVTKDEIILTLIADDHPYLIHGVETDLNKDSKVKIVGTVSTYDEVIDRAKELLPDVVLLDLKMPGRDKHELEYYIKELKAINNCKVMIFSNETGWARIHKCLDIGASAYIEKAISLGRLSEFIHRVHENDELVIFTAEELPKIKFPGRQKEVMHYIADGKENDEIAELLKVELKTVQSYINKIKTKLRDAFGVSSVRPRTLLLLASKLGFGSKVA